MKTYEEIEKLGTIIHIDEWPTDEGEMMILGCVDGYEHGMPPTQYEPGEAECFSYVTAWASPVGIHAGTVRYKEVFDEDLLGEIEKQALEHYS